MERVFGGDTLALDMPTLARKHVVDKFSLEAFSTDLQEAVTGLVDGKTDASGLGYGARVRGIVSGMGRLPVGRLVTTVNFTLMLMLFAWVYLSKLLSTL
jgi:hypothetical protein